MRVRLGQRQRDSLLVRGGMVAAVIAVAGLLPGCGGGAKEPTVATAGEPAPAVARPSQDGTQPPPTAGLDSAAQKKQSEVEKGIKFARCMTEHGVETPDPVAGAMPMSRLKTRSGDDAAATAFEACKKYYPSLTYRKLDPDEVKRQRAYAACMRGNGITDVPEPDATGELADEVNMGSPSPQFMSAHLKCRHHLPGAQDNDPPPQDAPGAGR